MWFSSLRFPSFVLFIPSIHMLCSCVYMRIYYASRFHVLSEEGCLRHVRATFKRMFCLCVAIVLPYWALSLRLQVCQLFSTHRRQIIGPVLCSCSIVDLLFRISFVHLIHYLCSYALQISISFIKIAPFAAVVVVLRRMLTIFTYMHRLCICMLLSICICYIYT